MSEWALFRIGLLALLVLIGIILLLIVWKKKKEGIVKEPNYQVFFVLGIMWFPVGVIFLFAVNSVIGFAFMAMGIAYLAISIGNRDKWKKRK